MENVSRIDANLFVVLDAVARHGSVTAAARELHVTQSAISNALARLREQFGDPLFVRVGRGLTPTPRMRELAPRIRSAVALLEGTMQEEVFDPKTTTRTFRLVCPDSAELSHVPKLVRLCARHLPRARLELMTTDSFVSAGGYAGVEVDGALAPAMLGGPGVHQTPLYDEEPVIIARVGHPRVKRTLSRAQFAALRHVEVEVVRTGSVGQKVQAQVLSRERLSLDVAVRVPHFLAAAAIVAETDYIAGLARSFAIAVSRFLPVRVFPYPITPVPAFPIALTWHDLTHRDEGSRLFRSLVLQAFGKKGAVPGQT